MTDREKTINGINKILGETDKYDGVLWDVLELLKEQEVKEQIYDAIHETAKQFRRQIVMCKDCNFKECEGRDGLIVCDITGESHKPDWFCADGERRDG